MQQVPPKTETAAAERIVTAHISSRIRAQMGRRDVTVKALADVTAIPRMTLTRRLTDPASMTFSELERIAAALAVTPEFLATGRGEVA